MITNDNIIALATPSGAGAIAVIRISGKDAIALANPFLHRSGARIYKNKKVIPYTWDILPKTTKCWMKF